MAKTKENAKKDSKPIVLPPRKKILDVRDYIIPTGRKRKTNWSEKIDEILYGKK